MFKNIESKVGKTMSSNKINENEFQQLKLGLTSTAPVKERDKSLGLRNRTQVKLPNINDYKTNQKKRKAK